MTRLSPAILCSVSWWLPLTDSRVQASSLRPAVSACYGKAKMKRVFGNGGATTRGNGPCRKMRRPSNHAPRPIADKVGSD